MYTYKPTLKEDGKEFLKEQLERYFPENRIWYMS